MMKTLDPEKRKEQGKQKIQQICEIIKQESIEPAKKKGEAIIEEAQAKAREIIKEAEKQAEAIHQQVRSEIEQERNIFQSSLLQASKLTVESLKQEIIHKLFNQELQHYLDKTMSDPKLIAKLIEEVIKAIEKEGLSTDISVVVTKHLSAKEINGLLGEHVLKKIRDHGVVLGDFTGGAKIAMVDKKMTIDISSRALMEILAGYASSFRKVIFESEAAP